MISILCSVGLPPAFFVLKTASVQVQLRHTPLHILFMTGIVRGEYHESNLH